MASDLIFTNDLEIDPAISIKLKMLVVESFRGTGHSHKVNVNTTRHSLHYGGFFSLGFFEMFFVNLRRWY